MSQKIITLNNLAQFKELYDIKVSSELHNAVDGDTIVLDENLKYALNEFLRGGYLVVETLEDRNRIPESLLKKGSVVKVEATKIVYEWDGVNWKKTALNIQSLGNGLVLSEGVLSVDTTDEAESQDSRPITSNGVYLILGDINDKLEEI